MKSPFLNAVAERVRVKFHAEKSIKAYLYWIKLYIYFNNKKHISCLAVSFFKCVGIFKRK